MPYLFANALAFPSSLAATASIENSGWLLAGLIIARGAIFAAPKMPQRRVVGSFSIVGGLKT